MQWRSGEVGLRNPATPCLESRWSSCDDHSNEPSSTSGAGDGDRTHGPLLGKQIVVTRQPSYRHNEPVPYPVANRPQAFAAAALPSLLTSILGLVPDAPHGKLYVVRPRLPFWLDFVRLAGLRVGEGTVDLIYHLRGPRTVVEVIGETSPVELVQTRRWPWR